MFAAVSIVSADAQSTYYLDTSGNTDWVPATGETLCATFKTSGNAQTGSKIDFEKVKDNLYKVEGVPSDAASIQIYLVRKNTKMLSTLPTGGKKRVFYNNTSANWDTPHVYSWQGAGATDADRNAQWPGASMTRIEDTSYWYYDAPFDNVIFNNGKEGSELVQTDDLQIEKDNPVFAKATGSAWESAPYYKKYGNCSIATPATGNDIYVQKNDSLKLSKYPYSVTDDDANPRSYTNTQVIYMYNPDWTDASKVKVTWDYNDPYQTTITMDKLTDTNKPTGVFAGSVPDGFYVATVPNDAKIQFSYDLATSNKTDVPTGQSNMCYNLKNSANIWCQLKDALGEETDFLVPVESGTGNNSHDSTTFWTDAVYYDYLSDEELNYSTWLRPIKAGTKPTNVGAGYNFDGAEDDWFEFYNLNSFISGVAANDSSWKYPLYFGNFCANWDAFLNDKTNPASRDTHSSALGKGYFGPNATGLTRFDYIVNNSNGLKPDANQVSASNHYGVAGLAYSTTESGKSSLNSDGNIQYAEGKAMPYFDSSWLKTTKVSGTKSIGKTLRSSFPFYKSTTGTGANQVTTYKFDSNPSTGQSDNVFFNWNGDKPQSVGYGRGTEYEVKDGYRNFMGDRDAGPGIFPFNNTSKTWGSRLANSSNLDYGFGIKINMDFRVPAGGKLPNGDDVKFSYSGDDDLWVYISEYDDNGKLKNSRLALDLGGNHKQASGEINFNTMKATANQVVNLKESDTYKRDRIYIKDVSSWGSVYVWAWNDSSDGKWYQANRVGSSDIWYISANQKDTGGNDRFDSKTMMAIVKDTNWSARASGTLQGGTSTNDNNGTGRDTIANHWGKVTYTNNVNWIDQDSADANYEYKENVETDFGFEPKRGTGYAQLDPTKTYHMTVFYMERGMIESNSKMEFTMTPARNDLKVKKIVETADVNYGLEDALKNQEFKFSNYETKVGSTQGVNYITRYTLNNETSTTSVDATGHYALKDQDVADFDNQYTTGSTMTVVEENRTPGVQYSTKWQVVDNAHGTKILPTGTAVYKDGRQTDGFVLEDSVISTNTAKLQVNVVNTPSVQSLNLSKKVRDESDQNDVANVDKEFKFQIKVDVDGGTNYKPYALAYKVIEDGDTFTLNTDSDGIFSFSAKDQVKIEGLPVGATYQIKEIQTPGYAPLRVKVDNGSDDDFSSGVMNGTIGSSDSTIAFTNIEKPISTKLKAKKYITDTINSVTSKTTYVSDGLGKELFSFTAHGLGNIKYDAADSNKESIDVSSTSKTIQYTNDNGEIIFGNKGGTDRFLNFTSTGVYIYSIVENGVIINNNKSSNDSLVTYKDDIGADITHKYLAKVTVTENATTHELEVLDDNIEYFLWDGNSPTAASFADNLKVTEANVEFDNPIKKHGKLTIIKTDSQNSLDGVEFTLYKVGAENEAITPTTEVVETKTTSNGMAEFDNLDIYEKTSDGKYKGAMAYQWYAVKETATKSGYMKEATVHYFRLPILDNSTVKYDIEFTYVNGALKSPSSGSVFGTMLPFGLALVVISMLSMLVFFMHKNKKPLRYARKRV